MHRFAIVLLGLGFVGTAVAGPWKVDALKDLRARYGLKAFDDIDGFNERLQRVKVAVIDNGFGDEALLAREMPGAIFKTVFNYPDAFIRKHAPRLGKVGEELEQVETDSKSKHGREMATLAWGLTGGSRTDAPTFYLLNGRGLFSLERAVQYAIDEKVDIILYALNWEYGGNFDGRGFINALVTRATSAGILWINAAGNYGGRVFNAPVKFETGKREAGPDTWLDLNGKKELRVRSRLDDNPAKFVLSWNRNSDDRKAGTDTDLDLFLYDEYGSLVASGETVQKFGGPGLDLDKDKGETLAKESFTADLSKNKGGYYTLRVKAKAGRFNGTDKLRITVIPSRSPINDAGKFVDPVELVDATNDREIMIPADHPDVISVGDLTRFTAKGPTADGRTKPDVYMVTSQVDFTNGINIEGTSSAAAMFTGVVAMLKAFRPALTRDEVLKFVKKQLPSQVQRGEARGVQDLGIDYVKERHPIVFQAIDERLRDGEGTNRSAIVLAGRYRRDGTYVVALDRSPAALSRWWRNIPRDTRDAEGVEIYMKTVTVGRSQLEAWCYVRSRQRTEGARQQDWEKELAESPEKFVEIIQARRIPQDSKEKELPMWKTPTPAELRALK